MPNSLFFQNFDENTGGLAVVCYMQSFFSNCFFQDVVDFTVGWYIEPEQPNSVVDKCHQVLTDLSPFWYDAIPAAVTLMKQFLDDASAYVEVILQLMLC